MYRFAIFIALSHNPRALIAYDIIWALAFAAAVPFAIRLRRAAREIDRRIRWERETRGDA